MTRPPTQESAPPPQAEPAPPKPRPAVASASARATLLNPIARILASDDDAPLSPHEFLLGAPPGVSAQDLDVIKLTAQYTAVGGRDFLSGLAAKEQRNALFDFLKPTHVLFGYFTALVDAYTKVLHPDAALRRTVESRADRSLALQLAVRRWDRARREEERKRRENSAADEERAAFLAVDWFDFVVVETIHFPPDEVLAPPPLMTAVPPPQRESRPAGGAESFQPRPAPAEDDSEIRVVNDYVPRVGQKRSAVTLVDPISGRALADSDVAEHMRVQLMDPRWRVEQQRFLEKQQDTGFAAGSSIASNLKELARRREDIFGGTEERPASTRGAGDGDRDVWEGHQAVVAQIASVRLFDSSPAAAPMDSHIPLAPIAPQPAFPPPPSMPPPPLTAVLPPAFVPPIPVPILPPPPFPFGLTSAGTEDSTQKAKSSGALVLVLLI